MNKPICDNCGKELSDAPALIATQEVVFLDKEGPPRVMRGLHHCDPKCLHSTIVKSFNRPTLIATNGTN